VPSKDLFLHQDFAAVVFCYLVRCPHLSLADKIETDPLALVAVAGLDHCRFSHLPGYGHCIFFILGNFAPGGGDQGIGEYFFGQGLVTGHIDADTGCLACYCSFNILPVHSRSQADEAALAQQGDRYAPAAGSVNYRLGAGTGHFPGQLPFKLFDFRTVRVQPLQQVCY